MTKLLPKTYLYSSQNQDLYKETLDQYNDRSCLFSRSLTAYLEGDRLSSKTFFKAHLSSCSPCQEKQRSWREMMSEINQAIPHHLPGENEKQLMNSECRQLLELVELRDKGRKIRAKQMAFNKFKKSLTIFFKEFFQAMYSKEFAGGTILAILSAYLVSLIL